MYPYPHVKKGMTMKINETNIVETMETLDKILYERTITNLKRNEDIDYPVSEIVRLVSYVSFIPSIVKLIDHDSYPVNSIFKHWVEDINHYFKATLKKPIKFTTVWNSFQNDVSTLDRVSAICDDIDTALKNESFNSSRTNPNANKIFYSVLNVAAVDILVKELSLYEEVPVSESIQDITDFLNIGKRYSEVERNCKIRNNKAYRYFNVHSVTIWLKKEFGYIFTEATVKKILSSTSGWLATVPKDEVKNILFEYLEQQLKLKNINEKRRI